MWIGSSRRVSVAIPSVFRKQGAEGLEYSRGLESRPLCQPMTGNQFLWKGERPGKPEKVCFIAQGLSGLKELARLQVAQATVTRKLGPMLSAGDFSNLDMEGWSCAFCCAYSSPSPLPSSGPEGGDLAQTATASGCLQVPAQLPKSLSCFHPCSWAGELGFQR